jgi:hypothetical protein
MVKYVWLYNTSHPDYWWLYDDENTNKLELIYTDYEKRENIKKNKNISINHLLNIENIENINNYFGNLIDDITYDPVHFDTNIEKTNNNVIDYTININGEKYLIDLENNYQKNMNNYMKKRKIKRIEISNNMNLNEFYNMNNIIGKNGVKFNLS